MPLLTDGAALDVAERMRQGSQSEMTRLGRVQAYIDGTYPPQAFVPEKLRAEYRALLARSRVPVLSLVVTSLTQRLFVDGFRPARAAENADQWAHWQANRMDARQRGVHWSAGAFGTGYLVILPGTPVPVWRPVSARRMSAVYTDREADQWPVYALEQWVEGSPDGRVERLRLYDAMAVYDFAATSESRVVGGAMVAVARAAQVTDVREHGLGVCPVVRFTAPHDLDSALAGEVEPLIPLQDQIDAATYYVEMAQQLAVHRQRWATGMAVPEDESGQKLEEYRAAISRLWQAEDPDTRFGEFGQTDIGAWLNAREATIRHMAIKSQTPPASLLGNMVEMSAEALAAAEIGQTRHVGEYQTSLGEQWEQCFRLDAMCSGDAAGAFDESAEVIWRDTESQSLTRAAQGLGQLAELLQIPPRGLWTRIPGVTDQDILQWEAMAAEGDALANLAAMQARQAAEPLPEELGAA